eukprot:gene1036-405_t
MPSRKKTPTSKSGKGPVTRAAAAAEAAEGVDGRFPFSIMKTNVGQRTVLTFVMVALFFGLLRLGPLAIGLFILVLQLIMFSEILSISKPYKVENDVPGFGWLPWWFCGVALAYLYIGQMKQQILNTFVEDQDDSAIEINVKNFVRFHTFNCFMAYMAGFVVFVLTLKRKASLPGLILLSYLSALEAALRFAVPCWMIISNDSSAYFFGKQPTIFHQLFGKHQLIALSPKKTWEGFLAGIFWTVVMGQLLSWFLVQFDVFLAPQEDLHFRWNVRACPVDEGHCYQKAQDLYASREVPIPQFIQSVVGQLGIQWPSITMSMFNFHMLVISAFASIIAPFGGFFASGLKRAFKMKDFGVLIPGHGGVTDRFDCQILLM